MVILTAIVASVPAIPVNASAAEPDLVRGLQWQIASMQLNDVHKKATGVGIIVAVVDSGVDPLHPDLTGQLVQGPESSNTDIDGRGTGLAGLIAGHGHGVGGEAGILGVAPGAKILPVAFAPGPGESGEADRLATGIELAINRGAKVICVARGVPPTERLDFAIEVAVHKEILVVAVDSTPWPASYPGVLSAVPADRSGVVRVPAASGRTTGLAAPGVDLVTTDRSSGYRIADTGSAAAILAGAAAVVWSANIDATGPQIAEVLRKTATTKDGVSSVNLMAALNLGVPKPAAPASPEATPTPPAAQEELTAGKALVHSRDWRRWLLVLPLIVFMAVLAAWAYWAGRPKIGI